MKDSIKICIIGLLVMSSLALQAAPRTYNQERHDFIYITTNLGYQSLIDTTESRYLDKYMGGGAELGVGYRYFKNNFIFQTGVSAHFGSYTMPLEDINSGVGFAIVNRKDVLHAGEICIPFLVGAEGFRTYFLVGPKIGYRFYGSALPTAELSGIAPITLIPNKQEFRYDWNIQGAFELGFRLGDVYREKGADVPYAMTRYYLALFAEGGIIRKNTFYPPCDLISNQNNGMATQLNPAMSTLDYIERMYANFSVGLKFTVLFEVAQNGKCLICKDHNKPAFEW